MNRQEPNPLVLAAALAAHLVVTGLTWRDLSRRTASEVRGTKALWRVLTALNTTGSLAYLLIGRQRA